MALHNTNKKGRFFLLCNKNRQGNYNFILAEEYPYKIVLIDNVENLIRSCIYNPPMGIFVDMVTSMQLGNKMNPIYNLRVNWPVMRCNIIKDGSIIVMCLMPNKRALLKEALDGIYNGDSSWQTSYRRQSIRLNVQCRVKIFDKGSSTASKGNIVNLSRGGSFFVTYDYFEKGVDVNIEIYDLFDMILKCIGTIAWSRKWEDSSLLPGAGISFDQDNIDASLKNALLKYYSKTDL